MSKVDEASRISELRRALTQADPAAFLVEPRVIRRVIRERFGFAQLSASIPHGESQVVAADDVRHLVHPDEMGLETFSSLPGMCLLICEPDEGELEHWPMQELLQHIWRRLFHAQIDRELLNRLHTTLHRAGVQERIAEIGQVEFDEAHFVLRSELRLVHPESRIEAWREFVALYLELKYFEPDLLPVWFPSTAGRPDIERKLARDIDHNGILERTQLYGAPKPDLTPHAVRDEARLIDTRRDWSLGIGFTPSDSAYLRQLRRRDRVNEKGNTVAAIVCAIRAMQLATSDDKRSSAQEKARIDVNLLAARLRKAIDFPERDTDAWEASLWELATNSIHGFWNSEKRLLYDLQKVCLAHERVTYKVDLVKWIVSRGRRPLRRPLNSLREVMMAKHLASSASRLVDVRLSGMERDRLTGLLHKAADLAEDQMRQRMRPVLKQTLLDVRLQPASVPEQVAFDKLVEDSLDCIADRGYLTMGYLRDAISKNDLKLPDLKEVYELWSGDHLLRSDDRLDLALDGVYRRGEFYLRALQITSSMFFGTRAGRFATLYLIIPFGGAVVIVEGVRHFIHMFHPKPSEKTSSEEAAPLSAQTIAEGQSADDAELTANGTDPGTPQPANSATESIKPGADTASADTASADTISPGLLSVDDNGSAEVDSLTAPDATGAELVSPDSSTGTREIVSVPPDDAREAFDQIVQSRVEILSWVLVIGFLLMGLIHISSFRHWFFRTISAGWKLLRLALIDTPLRLLRLPIVQKIWRDRAVVKFRRIVMTPSLVAFVTARFLPWLISGNSLSWWWAGLILVLSSVALNSRLGRDAQELTAEWAGNTWYKLRARVVMALIDWVIDLFRTLLSFMERFLYAVDEWLRFHSDESWLSVMAKAVLGVIWSFVSFVIRIYVNLLIEPTFHPVKHFPVVTVAHKMMLPGLIYLEGSMVDVLSPYLGIALARSFTWFNIFFMPGIFGFAVWELKENWRLYRSNRQDLLTAVPVGSHGETVARLLRPGFHSGTLPRLYRRLRRLEHQEASFKRFSARRVARGRLEHVEEAIRNFIERELIRLLQLCPAWEGTDVRCGHIHSASNSFHVELESPLLGDQPVRLLFQEQSGWVAASIPQTGWLRFASADQIRSFQNAVEGIYCKAAVDLVREQMEANFIHRHPYDINTEGLAIWPNGVFSLELEVDLNAKGIVRPIPASEAAAAGISSAEREAVVFNESHLRWSDWEVLWTSPSSTADVRVLPPACSNRSGKPVLPPIR